MNIIKKLFLFIASFLVISPVFAYIEKDVAILRVMDKASGKAQIMQAPIGKTLNRESLSIIVRNCKQSDPFDAENFFVFLEIYTKADGRIFSGWMNRNEPGLNPLQNDTYDVWIERCE